MQLAASTEQRLLERPPRPPAADRRRLGLIVLACLFAHVAVISLFVRFDRPEHVVPTAEETAVEVIVEPPSKAPDPAPAPDPAKDREQPMKQAVLDEKEATDAPRASEEKSEKDIRAEAPHAAQAAAKADPAETAQKPANSEPANAAEKSAQLPKNDQADGEPRPEAPEQTKAQKDAPSPDKPLTPSAPSISSNDALAAALRYAPVGGGNAQATYLSTVYGLIARHLNLQKVIAGRPHASGEILFAIDYGGAFVGAKVTKSSGLRDVDAAALAALRAAGPFPLPPTGAGLTLSFKFAAE